MDVTRADIENFEPISYTATLENASFPRNVSEEEDAAQRIGTDVASTELSKFLFELKKVPCKTVETTLDGLIETLDQMHDELWDLGFQIGQLFMLWVLKNEVRKQKQSVDLRINFSTQAIHPILANELGHSKIIFANKHCFGKTYPLTIEKQILIHARREIKNLIIDCEIIQNLHYKNLESMRKIIVTDVENSEFLQK
ncbi:MAG: hypothetical protein OEY17_05680 [Nitrosopumilus sp.]|nr:hypothetical protein [Nitrosopumilus sp.]MDH5658813.1 hypothetical protein [Nitrosopumilus sp.]